MKEIKIIAIATIVTICLIVSCAFATAEAEDRGEFYPKLSIVTEIETIGELKLISCTDKDGMVWSFYDDENYWEMGDIANLLMWNLSENEEADEVVEVYKEGHTENYNTFARAMGWR